MQVLRYRIMCWADDVCTRTGHRYEWLLAPLMRL